MCMTSISTEGLNAKQADREWRRDWPLPMSDALRVIHDGTAIMRGACGESLRDLAAIEKMAAGDDQHAPDQGMRAVIEILKDFSFQDRSNLRTDMAAIEARNMMRQLSDMSVIATRTFDLTFSPNGMQYPYLVRDFAQMVTDKGNGWVIGTLNGNMIKVKILNQVEFDAKQNEREVA